MADDIQNVRQFNTEQQLETVSAKVAEKLENLREDHELTWEFQRVNALTKGQVYDADGDTLLNDWYSEFGLSQDVVTVSAGTTDSPRLVANEITRLISRALGGDTFSGIHVLMGEEFADNFQTHAGVKEAYDRWQDGAFLRDNLTYGQFSLFKITWEEYRGQVGARQFIDYDTGGMVYSSNVAYAFPLGTRNIFRRYNCPSPLLEAVNQRGKPLYAKQIRDEWETMVKIHTSSNPLFVNCRPGTVVQIRWGA